MADDILGHDHLDHGKHLHRHGHGHHGHDKHAHGHKEPYKVQQPPPTTNAYTASSQHIGLKGIRHKRHVEEHQVKGGRDWRKWALIMLIAIPTVFFFYKAFTGLALAIAIILINTLIEYHKLFTSGTNLDFEVLSVGTAFVSAKYGIGWAFIIVLIGPVVAEVSRGYFSEKSLFKSVSLIVTALAAMLLGTSQWQLFIAVLFGLATYYSLNMVLSDIGPTQNTISRVSTAAFSAYLLFLLLPRFI